MIKQQSAWLDRKKLKALAVHVWRHFKEDRCFEEAASLGYTSLLSMVPLLAVVFGVVAAFPVFDQLAEKLQSFIFENFVPAAGNQVQAYISNFLQSATGLTVPGTLMLIVTALLLMLRIEKAFNRIWRVATPRTFGNRLVMYWAVLTLGPLTIGAATALSAQPVLAFFGLAETSLPWLRSLGIFVFTWLAFTLIFLLVPNRSVRLKHAAIGGVLSVILFELAKIGFISYVSNANFTVLYGTLATIPIFLFWLYVVWLVVLLGASLAASLTTFSYRYRDWEWPQEWEFQLLYRLVGHLWQAQRKGQGLSTEDLLAAEQHASDSQIYSLLKHLLEKNIVRQDENGDWFMTRDLAELSLSDLYDSGIYHLPLDAIEQLPAEHPWDQSFIQALKGIRSDSRVNLQRSLKSLYHSKHKEESLEIS